MRICRIQRRFQNWNAKSSRTIGPGEWVEEKRHDPLSKTIPTRRYNAATRWISGIQLNDFNCGLKAYRLMSPGHRSAREMHRYIPILAKSAGFDRTRQVDPASGAQVRFPSLVLNASSTDFDLMTIGFSVAVFVVPTHFFEHWAC